eukprot:scaffold24918_cov131-Isochrysis_galbana.AAC.4
MGRLNVCRRLQAGQSARGSTQPARRKCLAPVLAESAVERVAAPRHGGPGALRGVGPPKLLICGPVDLCGDAEPGARRSLDGGASWSVGPLALLRRERGSGMPGANRFGWVQPGGSGSH